MKEIYAIHAEMCKTFSNPTRLEIMECLDGRKLSVTELMEKTGLSQANISQHLSIMKSNGAVVCRREGKNICYSLSNPKIMKAFRIMKEIVSEKVNADRRRIQDDKG